MRTHREGATLRTQYSVPNISASDSGGDANSNNNSEDLGEKLTAHSKLYPRSTRIVGALEKPSPTFEGALLRALREHTFNIMPTRLLFFEPPGSNFQITLLDRSAVYKRLESALRTNFLEGELQSGPAQKKQNKWSSS